MLSKNQNDYFVFIDNELLGTQRISLQQLFPYNYSDLPGMWDSQLVALYIVFFCRRDVEEFPLIDSQLAWRFWPRGRRCDEGTDVFGILEQFGRGGWVGEGDYLMRVRLQIDCVCWWALTQSVSHVVFPSSLSMFFSFSFCCWRTWNGRGLWAHPHSSHCLYIPYPPIPYHLITRGY